MCEFEAMVGAAQGAVEEDERRGATPVESFMGAAKWFLSEHQEGDTAECAHVEFLKLVWTLCVARELRGLGATVTPVMQCMCDECLAVPVE